MTGLDYAAIVVLLGSIGWGVWRGLVREVMSLAGWAIAFFAANAVGGLLGEMLPAAIGSPEVRVLVGFVAVFFLTLLAATWAGMLLSKAFKAVGLSGVDRSLGGVFGLARGIVILLAFTIAAGMTALPRDAQWKESVAAGMLERTVLQLKPWLPQALAGRLKYN